MRTPRKDATKVNMNELIPRNAVTEIVAHRDAALNKARDALMLMQRAQEVVAEAQAFAASAHQGNAFHGLDRTADAAYKRLFHPVDVAASLDAYRKHLDACVWTNLMERTGMSAMMDRQAKDEFYRDLCGSVPEVTEDSVWSTLQGLAGDAVLIFQRGLARAFVGLDGRFRSHDAFKLGERVILTNVFDGYGMWNYHSGMRETITDLERVFTVLDNERDPEAAIGSLARQIEIDRGHGWSARQSVTESRYFRVRCHKNGNAHLWFTRDDLVQKANETLAAYYGAVLPDAVPDDVSGSAVRSYALSTDLAFYPTPPEVAHKALAGLDLPYHKDAHVLEPSAGDGAIVRELLKAGAKVHAIEVHPHRVAVLKAIVPRALHARSQLQVQEANFLQIRATPMFTHVVMNPPFCGTHWMAHVRHAFDFLVDGGSLVAVLPVSAEIGTSAKHEAFRAWVESQATTRWRPAFSPLPLESFAASGTRVSTVLLTMVRGK